jgi:hypothetical protein
MIMTLAEVIDRYGVIVASEEFIGTIIAWDGGTEFHEITSDSISGRTWVHTSSMEVKPPKIFWAWLPVSEKQNWARGVAQVFLELIAK